MRPIEQSWMKRWMVLAAVLTLVSWVAAVQAGQRTKAPAKKKGPKLTEVVGQLEKTVNKKKKLTAAWIKQDDGKTVHVMLDKKGVKLARTMAGKRVALAGKMQMRGKGKAKKAWLRVVTYKAAPAPAPAKEEAAADADEEAEE